MDHRQLDRPQRTRRQALAMLVAGTGLLGVGGSRAQEQVATLGIVPYLPAQRLVTLYAPLQPVLQAALGTRVELASARDYRAHVQRLRDGAYDVVADSLFIARLAQRELGHVPIARTQAPLEPLLVVAADSAVANVAQLRGRAIAVTDRLAALTVLGTRGLREQGLIADRDYTLVISGSHANSLHRVLVGDATAAIVSVTTLAQVDPSLASRVRVLVPLPKGLSAVVYHVAPRWRAHAAALSQAMVTFAATPPGQAFVRALRHRGLLPARDEELRDLDPFVLEYYRLS